MRQEMFLPVSQRPDQGEVHFYVMLSICGSRRRGQTQVPGSGLRPRSAPS